MPLGVDYLLSLLRESDNILIDDDIFASLAYALMRYDGYISGRAYIRAISNTRR